MCRVTPHKLDLENKATSHIKQYLSTLNSNTALMLIATVWIGYISLMYCIQNATVGRDWMRGKWWATRGHSQKPLPCKQRFDSCLCIQVNKSDEKRTLKIVCFRYGWIQFLSFIRLGRGKMMSSGTIGIAACSNGIWKFSVMENKSNWCVLSLES